ncbi:MAG: hypothetical protein HY753_04825, partial [Nitrospirae bacterium]|nr:hypothetical protein [Nitrospirota bacterium]
MRGNGYSATQPIRIEFGTTPTIQWTSTYAQGSFTTTFTLDTQPYGTTTIIAHQDNIDITAYGTLSIQPNIIPVTPNSGTVGTIVTVRGNGYPATNLLRVEFRTTDSIQTTSSVIEGSFTTTFTIDTQPYATTTITVYQGVIKASDTFFILPNIILISPDHGTVGTIITLKGNGYSATQSIRIEFGTTPTIVMASTYAQGLFSTTWTINTQPYGKTTIIAHQDDIKIKAYGTFAIESNIILISPKEGTVGTIITVKCNGFVASKTIKL